MPSWHGLSSYQGHQCLDLRGVPSGNVQLDSGLSVYTVLCRQVLQRDGCYQQRDVPAVPCGLVQLGGELHVHLVPRGHVLGHAGGHQQRKLSHVRHRDLQLRGEYFVHAMPRRHGFVCYEGHQRFDVRDVPGRHNCSDSWQRHVCQLPGGELQLNKREHELYAMCGRHGVGHGGSE